MEMHLPWMGWTMVVVVVVGVGGKEEERLVENPRSEALVGKFCYYIYVLSI
jgi:hypothetical protein